MAKKKQTTKEAAGIIPAVFRAPNGRIYSLKKEYNNDLVKSYQENFLEALETEKIEVYNKKTYTRTYTNEDTGKTRKKVIAIKGYRSSIGREVGEEDFLRYIEKNQHKTTQMQRIINSSFMSQIQEALAKGAKVEVDGEVVTLKNFKKIRAKYNYEMRKAKKEVEEIGENSEGGASPLVMYQMKFSRNKVYKFQKIN